MPLILNFGNFGVFKDFVFQTNKKNLNFVIIFIKNFGNKFLIESEVFPNLMRFSSNLKSARHECSPLNQSSVSTANRQIRFKSKHCQSFQSKLKTNLYLTPLFYTNFNHRSQILKTPITSLSSKIISSWFNSIQFETYVQTFIN